jgi:predicted methyltransferase
VLQLETETKARLRPFLTRLGLSIAQDDVRGQVAEFAQKFASKSWHDHMRELAGITHIYLEKFRALASAAPDEDREIAQSMVAHEAAINRFAQLELDGDAANSLDGVIAQLQYPLPRPA